jgi:hypothetical protein
MVICKKKYKSPVLSLSPCPLRKTTGHSARGTSHAGNGLLKDPPLFLRNMKLFAVTMMSCSVLAATCNKGQPASSTPEQGNQTLVIGLEPEQNALKFIEATGGDCQLVYASTQGPGIEVKSGSDASAR